MSKKGSNIKKTMGVLASMPSVKLPAGHRPLPQGGYSTGKGNPMSTVAAASKGKRGGTTT